MEIAFIRLPDGRAWIGEGPFVSLEQPDSAEGCFYVNDFDLSDPKPWKRPALLREVNAESIAKGLDLKDSVLKIQWDKPATEWFKMAFRRIRREVLAGRLEKMVPVLVEKGRRLTGQPLTLLTQIMDAPTNLWCYAHATGDQGFLGASPELLFSEKGGHLETMALAGTAKPGNQQDFLTDVKEIGEHEYVVSFLEQHLSQIGTVTRGTREVLETAGLVHFKTKLSAEVGDSVNVNDLIRILHPTPAVGCLPRTEEWLSKLKEYRTQLKAPGFFGAPFGFSIRGEHHLIVSIRGISWHGDEITLPSGCGIVGGSAFDHEWRELRLKREAVLRLLGV
jgi:menaquinone-specific isochorismate synthase